MMKENKMYRKRDGIIGLVIGVYILSRIFHIPVPIISSLSVFHLLLLIGLIYYISGLVIKNQSKNEEASYSSSYEAMEQVSHSQENPPHPHEPEHHLSVRNHVDHIQLQYYENIERFSMQIKQAIVSEQLYELDKMKHSNYFYSLLKENAKIEAVWTMDKHLNVVAAIPYDITPTISDEAKKLISFNKVYTSSLDELFDSTKFIQTLLIPITTETDNVIGHIGLQIKCI